MRCLLTSFILWIALIAITMQQAYANDEAVYKRSLLVLNPEFRMNSYETGKGAAQSDMDIAVYLGLDWPGFRYVSIQALIGLGCMTGWDDTYRYRYHNQYLSRRAVGSLNLKAVVDIHTSDRLVSLLGALRGQMTFTSGRTGIFTFESGPGVMVRPFDQRKNVLRSASFGLVVWFLLSDDFAKVFDLERHLVNPSLEVMLEF